MQWLKDNSFSVVMVILWPFLMLMYVPVMAWLKIAPSIPGTKANMVARLKGGWHPEWSKVCQIWSTSQSVCAGPIGPSAHLTPEYLLLNVIAGDSRISTEDIFNAISVSNATLSAYCIIALTYRDEYNLLNTLPIEILQSPETICVRLGCPVSLTTLGEFATTRLSQPSD